MYPKLIRFFLLFVLLFPALAPAQPASGPNPYQFAPSQVSASIGSPKRGNARFYELHASFLKRTKEPIGVLFLGDSITEGWRNAPETWEKYYGQYKPANFGIGGDQTQHVIWRIEDGELDGINPKLVVLMIGTNNTGGHSAEQILEANRKIVYMIRAKLPETKVLVLAIFPRGPRKNPQGELLDDGVVRMQKITEVNAGLAKLDDGKMIRFLDINRTAWLNEEGKIPNEIMPDQLHPVGPAYVRWAEAMQPLFLEMMQ